MTLENISEAQLYNHVNQLLKSHEKLLGDKVRNQAFYKALQKCVTKDSVVLDIGAGTGVWAISAARLGVKKVVAIEADALMVGLIKMLVAEQGVANCIEVLQGDSRQIQLEKEFDIVISETIGNFGYDEQIVEIMSDAQTRFLKKNGLIIPETISLVVAAAHLKSDNEILPSGLPVDFTRFANVNLNSPIELKKKTDLKLMTKPQHLIRTNLYKAKEQIPLENLTAVWQMNDTFAINCFIVWAESRLTKGVKLNTRQTTSWSPSVYRIKPTEMSLCKIEFTLSITDKSHYWSVRFSNEDKEETQSYSPAFAATDFMLSLQMDDQPLIQSERMFLHHLDNAEGRHEVRA